MTTISINNHGLSDLQVAWMRVSRFAVNAVGVVAPPLAAYVAGRMAAPESSGEHWGMFFGLIGATLAAGVSLQDAYWRRTTGLLVSNREQSKTDVLIGTVLTAAISGGLGWHFAPAEVQDKAERYARTHPPVMRVSSALQEQFTRTQLVNGVCQDVLVIDRDLCRAAGQKPGGKISINSEQFLCNP